MEDNLFATPPELEDLANQAKDTLIPHSSKTIYEKWFSKYEDFLSSHNLSPSNTTSNIFISFFKTLSTSYAASTLWTIFSCLKCILSIRYNVDVDDTKFHETKSFLKQLSSTHLAKKSKVFTREEVETFLINAPTDIYLLHKLVLLIGLCGALRCGELLNLQFEDISDCEDHILITIRVSKTDKKKKGFVFVALASENSNLCPVTLYRNYKALVANPTGKFFRQFHKKKFTAQHRGKNFFGNAPKEIAAFLKYPEDQCKFFTGHAFRRTSATLCADSGASLIDLKRIGRWKSDSVATGYIEESEYFKKKAAHCIQNIESQQPPKKKARLEVESVDNNPSVFLNCSNINFSGTINFNIQK